MASKKRSIDEVTSDSEFEELRKRRSESSKVARKPPQTVQSTLLLRNAESYSHDLELRISSPDFVANPFCTNATLPAGIAVLDPRRAPQIPFNDMQACFELIKTTSQAHYRASSRGWNPKAKLEEMKDANMWYILVSKNGMETNDPDSLLSPAALTTAPARSIPPAIQTATSSYATTPTSLSSVPSNASSVQPWDTPTENPIVGFLSFKFENDDPPNDRNVVLYIYEIHLCEGLRGQKLGGHLLTAAEKICRVVGLGKVMLTAFTSNETASAIYRKKGYYIDEDCSPRSREVRGRKIPPEYRIRSKIVVKVGE